MELHTIVNYVYNNQNVLINKIDMDDILFTIIDRLKEILSTKKHRNVPSDYITSFYDNMRIRNYDTSYNLINYIENPIDKQVVEFTYNYVRNRLNKNCLTFIFERRENLYDSFVSNACHEKYLMEDIVKMIEYAVKYDYVEFFNDFMPIIDDYVWSLYDIENRIISILGQRSFTFDLLRIIEYLNSYMPDLIDFQEYLMYVINNIMSNL